MPSTDPPPPAASAIPVCGTAAAGLREKAVPAKKPAYDEGPTGWEQDSSTVPPCPASPPAPQSRSLYRHDDVSKCPPASPPATQAASPIQAETGGTWGCSAPRGHPVAKGSCSSPGQGHRGRQEPLQWSRTCPSIPPGWRPVPPQPQGHDRCPVTAPGLEDGTHVLAEGLMSTETPKLEISVSQGCEGKTKHLYVLPACGQPPVRADWHWPASSGRACPGTGGAEGNRIRSPTLFRQTL